MDGASDRARTRSARRSAFESNGSMRDQAFRALEASRTRGNAAQMLWTKRGWRLRIVLSIGSGDLASQEPARTSMVASFLHARATPR
jgi:hypothetical protein